MNFQEWSTFDSVCQTLPMVRNLELSLIHLQQVLLDHHLQQFKPDFYVWWGFHNLHEQLLYFFLQACVWQLMVWDFTTFLIWLLKKVCANFEKTVFQVWRVCIGPHKFSSFYCFTILLLFHSIKSIYLQWLKFFLSLRVPLNLHSLQFIWPYQSAKSVWSYLKSNSWLQVFMAVLLHLLCLNYSARFSTLRHFNFQIRAFTNWH